MVPVDPSEAADPLRHQSTRPGTALEALPDGPREPRQVDAYTQGKEEMLLRTDTDHAPWHTVKSNSKQRARFSGLRLFLSLVDYDGKDEQVVLQPDAKLVAMDLRQPCIDGRVGRDDAVDVGEPEVPADGVHHRDDRGVHQPLVAELADVELDKGSLDPGQGVQPVALAPGKPLPDLATVPTLLWPMR